MLHVIVVCVCVTPKPYTNINSGLVVNPSSGFLSCNVDFEVVVEVCESSSGVAAAVAFGVAGIVAAVKVEKYLFMKLHTNEKSH